MKQTWIYTAPISRLTTRSTSENLIPALPRLVTDIVALGLKPTVAWDSSLRLAGRRDTRRQEIVTAPAWGGYVLIEADLDDLPRLHVLHDLTYLDAVPERVAEDVLRPLLAGLAQEHAQCLAKLVAAVEAEREADRVRAETDALREAAETRAAEARAEAHAARAQPLGSVLTLARGAMAGAAGILQRVGDDGALIVGMEFFGRIVPARVSSSDVEWDAA